MGHSDLVVTLLLPCKHWEALLRVMRPHSITMSHLAARDYSKSTTRERWDFIRYKYTSSSRTLRGPHVVGNEGATHRKNRISPRNYSLAARSLLTRDGAPAWPLIIQSLRRAGQRPEPITKMATIEHALGSGLNGFYGRSKSNG